MLPLKEDDTYAVLSDQGMVGEHEEGFYRHDTRYLSRYRWNLPGFHLLLSETPRPDHLVQHWGLIVGPDQKVGLRRELVLYRGGFRDSLEVENTSLEPHTLELSLDAAADFVDLFEARGWHRVTRKVTGFSYTSEDGLEVATRLEAQPAAPDGRWKLELKPHEKARIAVEARFETS